MILATQGQECGRASTPLGGESVSGGDSVCYIGSVSVSGGGNGSVSCGGSGSGSGSGSVTYI